MWNVHPLQFGTTDAEKINGLDILERHGEDGTGWQGNMESCAVVK